MKQFLFGLAILAFALRLPAQTNEPVRLALVAASDEASPALDILTAELSSHTNLQLLERDQIAKVYQEQALSAGNQDYLKLGQILGADGLLILNVAKTPTTTNLTIQLIAVKPGVVLADVSFPWPMKDISPWAESLPVYLNPFLPKLSVLVKDAIPLSVVNLRSAIASEAGAETEKELKLLTIQRLSRERQIFVLERQKMQLLADEKNLKADDSAFWNGSYLLEGVIDQNGYSKDIITINARLKPPQGGLPVLLEVSGSRTNLPAVIDQLAVKVTAALKINSSVKEWQSADEAEQYFNEAKWALRWKIFPEAQGSADSAWALGKKDLDCALVRVNSYLWEALAKTGDLVNGSVYVSPSDVSGLDSEIREISGSYFAVVIDGRPPEIKYVALDNPPDPRNIDRALHALELYYEFSRTSPDGIPQILTRAKGGNDWHNSPWYNLGIEDLIAASKVLQQFSLVPQLQAPVADKLAELRALARSVSNLISQSPSVHDSYYVGDRVVTRDELAHTIDNGDPASCIFNCQVIWGYLWQDTPEDGIALYRELMNSPVFCYIHSNFWCREPGLPRLVGWNDEDRGHIPEVWNRFTVELTGSTNLLLRLEGEALAVVDAGTDEQMEPALHTLMDDIRSNRTDLVENNVELFYNNWSIGSLFTPTGVSHIQNPALDGIGNQCRTNYFPMLEAMDHEYWSKTTEGNTRQGNLAAFENQKQFLRADQPFDTPDAPQNFVQMFVFGFHDYSKAQALEIQPLLAAYKSNLLEQTEQLPFQNRGWARLGVIQVKAVEAKVNGILNPPASSPSKSVAVQAPQPIPKAPPVARTSTVAPEIVTNVLPVTKFLEIPLAGLPGDQISAVTITGHHWFEGKLLLDLTYHGFVYSYDQQGNWKETRDATFQAIAILEPATEKWNVIAGSEIRGEFENHFYHQSVIWNSKLFHSHGGQIQEYNLPNGHWQVLPISDGSDYELFNVNGHLYGANGNVILEITDNGTSTHLLASTRRQPAASALDTEDLGTPTLFAGPDQTLRVSTKNKIFTWTGRDWREDSATPPASFSPAVFGEGVLFRESEQTMSLSFISTETTAAKLCLWQRLIRPDLMYSPWAIPQLGKAPELLWKLPPDLVLAKLAAAECQTNLYLFINHTPEHPATNDQPQDHEKLDSQNEYDATLLCFSPGLPRPQKAFLKFDAPGARPPITHTSPRDRQWSGAPPSTWMLFTTNSMYCGLEKSSIFAAPDPSGTNKAGVWVMPLGQLQAATEKQRQDQLAEISKDIAAAKQTRQDLLAKYDHNHNGVIDPDEKEEALDDPAFIESELDTIDANHNGWLDAAELAYFDANQNKTLEPKEEAGIEIAQHLLAARLFQKFDANGNGILDSSEFIELVLASQDLSTLNKPGMPNIFDADRDGQMNLKRLERFLAQQTRAGLSVRRMPGFFRPPGDFAFNPQRPHPSQPVDQQAEFKEDVQSYWKKTGGSSSRQPSNSTQAN